MGISAYLKDIGRGAHGARALTRHQAADLLGQVLDGQCSDLELGAFCVAMRIKGETPPEMAGFLDAVQARLQPLPAQARPTVVLPSCNGARKLPLLTPLLALLLAREGLPVLLHGRVTEDRRVTTPEVLAQLDEAASASVRWVDTAELQPGLARLLDVRRVLGLRNSAHSLVKLLTPVAGPALLVSSYTHPEYARSMAATLQLTGTSALLLRGTEGEPVADPRRQPRIQRIDAGVIECVQDAQSGVLTELPALPCTTDAAGSADYTRAVLRGARPVPAPLARQIEHILQACARIEARSAPSKPHPVMA